MKTMHLFAGCGGGILADLILGHKPIAAIEIDRHCCNVLRQRRQDGWLPYDMQIIEADIREIDFSPWRGRVDQIAAGFPCQDISWAGKGAGLKGENSGLYWEAVRAIKEIQPDIIFLENVPAIQTRGREEVIASLLKMGYAWRDGTLDAADVGAPHLRSRWWCLAANSKGIAKLKKEKAAITSWLREDPSIYVDHARQMQHAQPGAISEKETLRVTHTIRGCTEARAWPAPYFGLCRMVHGISGRVDRPPRGSRITMLGNAQVPLQAALAWITLVLISV